MLKITIAITLIVNSLYLLGQSIPYENYSVDDGLPSSEVYSVITDQKGFMWFGTDRGVARFDGREFDVFTTENGLLNNVVFNIYEDHLGRIWFTSYSGEICYFFENEIHEYLYNDIINNFSKRKIVLSFFVDSESKLYLGLKREPLISIDSAGTLEKFIDGTTASNIFIAHEGAIFSSYPEYHKDSLNYLSYLTEENSSKLQIPEISRDKETVPRHLETIRSAVIDYTNNDVYFSVWNVLYIIQNGQITLVKKLDQRILDISICDENIVVGLYSKGFKIYKKELNYPLVHQGLDGYSVSDFSIDEEENSCFTTLENGVFFSKNTDFLTYTKNNFLPSNNVLKIQGSPTEILFGDDRGNLSVMNLRTREFSHSRIQDNYNAITEINYDEKANKFYITQYGLSVYQNGERSNLSDYYIFDFLFIGEDSLLVLDRECVQSIKNQTDKLYLEPIQGEYLSNDVDIDRYTFTSLTKQKGKLYFGGLEGLYKVENSQLEYLGDQNKLFQFRIIEFCQLNSGDFCFATRGAGLVYYNLGKPYSISRSDGLISDQLSCVSEDKNGDIWVGSSKGVSIIKADKKTIINLSKAEGLVSNEVNDIYLDSTRAYIATKFGVSILEKSKVKHIKKDIPIYFKSLSVNDSLINLQTKNYKINIDYKEPYMQVKFIGLSFNNPKEINYRYRLRENEPWKYTKNNEIVFSELGSGKYNLEISASTKKNEWNKNPAVLSIYVKNPFYKEIWFIISSIILIISILTFIIYIIIKRIRRQEFNKRQIQSLKIEALNSRMNPHFIFNSLNSIQSFILKNDKITSNRYLSKFSKLMRMTLDQSKQTNVSLARELELIGLYTDLQNVRFENLIELKIEIDEKIDVNRMLIPSLLIQPIVENAILHGLIPSKKEKRIKISLMLSKANKVTIEVEDNGIGRKAAQLNSKHDHISSGNKLVLDRLNLFANQHKSESYFEIFDLENLGNPTGTRIQLKIPYVLNEDF